MSHVSGFTTGGGGGGTGTVTTVLGGINITITGTPSVNPIVNVSGPPSPTTYTMFGVLYGNDTGPIQVTAAGIDGQVLISHTGAAPTWGTVPVPPTVPLQFTENTGIAIPSANNINVLGSGAITTTGSGSTVTITAPFVATSYVENTGTAIPAGGILNVIGAGTVTTSGSGNTITITGTNGPTVPTTFHTQSGDAIPALNILNISGSGGLTTSGTGNTVTITSTAVTSFTVDKNDATITTINAFQGTVIPASNVLRLGGDNGIVTNQTGVAGAIIIDFVRGNVSSTGTGTFTVLTYTLASDTVLTMQVIVVGRDIATGDGVGGQIIATVKNVAGTVTIINTADPIINRDVSLSTASFSVTGSGANFIVTVNGVTGKTIHWNACLPGIVVTQ